jgi:prolyl-tRNA synthetase
MKDSYSFDVDDDGLQRSYDRHREAYVATFDRLGLPYVIVSAMSGAMGGSASEEFLAPIDVGEDTFVRCGTSCDYAANVEAVEVPPRPPRSPSTTPPRCAGRRHPRHTDDRHARRLAQRRCRPAPRDDRDWTAADTLKNVVVSCAIPTAPSSRWRSDSRATARST